jgi:hypothetical protein
MEQMAELINADLTESLERLINGGGETISFSPKEIEADQKRHAELCEANIRSERARQAKSIEAASKIYLTF